MLLNALAIAAAMPLAGCKIVSLDQDRALREQRSGSFDAGRFIARDWTERVRPALDARAVAFAEIDKALAIGVPQAGARLGRQAGEGSPWTFVARGEGVVTAVDTTSRAGTIALQVPGADGVRTLEVQTGPVIIDTALRDSLPFLSFDDFTDQIAYAGVGKALTDRALKDTRAVAKSLKPGDKVRFLGAFGLSAADQPIRLVPIVLARV